MTAQIIDFAVQRAKRQRPVARVRLVLDPWWPLRLWLACWGIR